MIVSHTKKFIFFHLYKVAGTSIRKSLEKYKAPINTVPHIKPALVKDQLFNGYKGEFLLKEYFKFSFVRNPWDWQVSLYFFMLRDKAHWQYNIIKNMNFEEYLDWRVNEDCKPQYMFLSENADLTSPINIDFIGKYEYLNSDFNKICEVLNLDSQLPHLNKTNHQNYTTYYTDKTRKMVEEAFKIDIDYFGYDFNNEKIISGEEMFLKNNKLTHGISSL
tara:strand:- start:7618 stop:8274 length:657 start_codon:yes stop_codon:yes gene_type:complete